MAEEGKQLLIRVRAPGQEIQKDLQKVNTIVISETKQTARQQITILRDTERQQIDAYKRRAIAEQEVLRATLKSEKDRQRAILETERVATESLRRQVMAERAARQPGSGSGFGIARTFAGFTPGGAVQAGLGALGFSGIQSAANGSVQFIKESKDAYRDYIEQVNKTGEVFRNSKESIMDWAKGSAQGFAMSQTAAMQAASDFGNLFNTLGQGREKSAEMSKQMVQLAADLSSFHNIGIADAFEKLKAGLVGEMRPLRDLGVQLDEFTLKNRAMQMGLVKSSNEVLPPQIKMMAAYEEILRQTKDAQGDFARTSGEVANSERILQAEIDDLKKSVGEELLPVWKDWLKTTLALVDGLGKLAGGLPRNAASASESALGQPGSVSFRDRLQANATAQSSVAQKIADYRSGKVQGSTGYYNSLIEEQIRLQGQGSALAGGYQTALKMDAKNPAQKEAVAAVPSFVIAQQLRDEEKANKVAETERRRREAEAERRRREAAKTQADRLRGREINAQTRLRGSMFGFETGLESLSDATSGQQITDARFALVGLMGDIRSNQQTDAMATLKRDKQKDPKRVSEAYARYYQNLQAIQQDDQQRAKQVRDAVDEAQKRLANAYEKKVKLEESNFEETSKNYDAYLKEEEKTLEMSREKNVSIEEDKKLVDALVDNRQRQAALELQVTLLEQARPGVARGAASGVGGIISGFVGGVTSPVGATALGNYRNRLSEISQFREENFGTVTPQMPFNDRNGADFVNAETISVGGGELTREKGKTRAGREQGREIEEAFQRGITDLFMAIGKDREEQKSILKSVLSSLLAEGQGIAARSVTEEIGRVIKRDIVQSEAVKGLKSIFADLGKGLKDAVKGLDVSSKGLMQAGLGIYNIASLLSGSGKKKRNTLLGGVLGFAAGSILPGIGNLEGANIGAAIGGSFASGGRPPIGRASLVGEHGPELFIPDSPGTILSNGDSRAAVGGGGITMVVHGGINNGADAELISRQLEMKRKRERLVR